MGVPPEAIPVLDSAGLETHLNPRLDVLVIEEVQFFDERIIELAVRLADNGIEVIVAGLDQDFRRQPFGPMPALLGLADEVVKLRAICLNCGAPASHTYRMINGKPAHRDDPVILIGATEAYEARCRNCFELKGSGKKKWPPKAKQK